MHRRSSSLLNVRDANNEFSVPDKGSFKLIQAHNHTFLRFNNHKYKGDFPVLFSSLTLTTHVYSNRIKRLNDKMIHWKFP